MDLSFPIFVRASTDVDVPHSHDTPTKSLLQLVVEAGGKLGLVPQRAPARRDVPAAHGEQQHGRDASSKAAADGGDDDDDDVPEEMELRTLTGWTPPAYILEYFSHPTMVRMLLRLHDIRCGSAGNAHGVLPPPLLRVGDLRLPHVVEVGLRHHLMHSGGGRRPAHFHARPGDASRTITDVERERVAMVATLKQLILPTRGMDGGAQHAPTSLANTVALRGIQSVGLTPMLLGSHVLLGGPRGIGKRTAVYIALGSHLLSQVEDDDDDVDDDAEKKEKQQQRDAPRALCLVHRWSDAMEMMRSMQAIFGSDAFSFTTFARDDASVAHGDALPLEPVELRDGPRGGGVDQQQQQQQQQPSSPQPYDATTSTMLLPVLSDDPTAVAPPTLGDLRQLVVGSNLPRAAPTTSVAPPSSTTTTDAPPITKDSRKTRRSSTHSSADSRDHRRHRRNSRRSPKRRHRRHRSRSGGRSHRHHHHHRHRHEGEHRHRRERSDDRHRRGSRRDRRSHRSSSKDSSISSSSQGQKQHHHDGDADAMAYLKALATPPPSHHMTAPPTASPLPVLSEQHHHEDEVPQQAWLPSFMRRRVVVLVATYAGFHHALSLVDDRPSAYPLEHVRVCAMMHAEHLTHPPLKERISNAVWLLLANAVDVDCRFLVTADGSMNEVEEFCRDRLIPDGGDALCVLEQRDGVLQRFVNPSIATINVVMPQHDAKDERINMGEVIEEAKLRTTAEIILDHFFGSSTTTHENNEDDDEVKQQVRSWRTANGKLMIIANTRREQQTVVEGVGRLLCNMEDHQRRPALIQLASSAAEAMERDAEVLVLTDAQLTDLREVRALSQIISNSSSQRTTRRNTPSMIKMLSSSYAFGVVLHYSLPRRITAPQHAGGVGLGVEAIVAMLMDRSRPLIGPTRRVAAMSEDGTLPRLRSLLLLTERQQRGKLGEVVMEALQHFDE